MQDVSSEHLQNELSFALLRKVNIVRQLDDVYLADIRRHNELVDRDRFTLTRVINGIKFCLEFEGCRCFAAHLLIRSYKEGELRPEVNPPMYELLVKSCFLLFN